MDILGLDNDSNPKESTCKGGFVVEDVDEEEPEVIVLKNSSGDIVNGDDVYNSITEEQRAQIVESVEGFFNTVLSIIPSKFNLDNNFGVENASLKIAREECTKDLATYLDTGIELSIAESGNADNVIEDALSFYPIKGALQSLSAKLQEFYNV